MKEKYLFTFLSVEAAVCVLFRILQRSASGLFSTMAAFPFEQIGTCLRVLSLSGGVGNGISIFLYLLVSLIPVMIWFFLKWKGKAELLDFLLFPLSLLLFGVLFYMINPGLLNAGVPGTGKWSLGSTFYSILVGYLLIRTLFHYENAGIGQIQKGLWLLLGMVNVVLVYGIFGQELGILLQNLEGVQNGNASADLSGGFFTGSDLTLTCVFLFLHFLIKIVPYALNIMIVFDARKLLAAMKEDLYQEKSVETAQKLGKLCLWTLVVTLGLDGGFNLLQLFFQSRLYQMEYVINVPVFSMAFVLAVLLFARYVREMQRLKADNDLFI